MLPDRYISDISRPVVVPYQLCLSNALYQQDNARPLVAYQILTLLDTQSIRLRSRSARSSDLSLVENVLTWIAERLAHHPSPPNTVDGVWQGVNAAWNQQLVSNRIKTI
ncbi:hypothetical protein TNCV_1963521 [Trichonephila clavipes]|nr:hypothetical protein TNCV_1963521 [Trichonephila clavipes]